MIFFPHFFATNCRAQVDKHDGYLPIRLKAVPEGMVVQGSNVFMTLENTDTSFAWLILHVQPILNQITSLMLLASFLMEKRNMHGVVSIYYYKVAFPSRWELCCFLCYVILGKQACTSQGICCRSSGARWRDWI